MTILQIKRGITTPSSLAFGELGFDDATNNLFVGKNNGTIHKFSSSQGSSSPPIGYSIGSNWNEIDSSNNRIKDTWFWNGFNWIKRTEKTISFDPALTYSTVSGRWIILPIPSEIAGIYPQSIIWSPVLGNNDSSNYWNASLTIDSASIDTISTSTLTSGSFKRVQKSITGAYGTTWNNIGVSFFKTGNPGNLQPGSITFSCWIAR